MVDKAGVSGIAADDRQRCRHCGKDNPENPPARTAEAELDERRRTPEGKCAVAIAAMERAFGTGAKEANELLRENSGAKRIYDCAIIALIAISDGDTAPGVRS